jgi:hypothetical protein
VLGLAVTLVVMEVVPGDVAMAVVDPAAVDGGGFWDAGLTSPKRPSAVTVTVREAKPPDSSMTSAPEMSSAGLSGIIAGFPFCST